MPRNSHTTGALSPGDQGGSRENPTSSDDEDPGTESRRTESEPSRSRRSDNESDDSTEPSTAMADPRMTSEASDSVVLLDLDSDSGNENEGQEELTQASRRLLHEEELSGSRRRRSKRTSAKISYADCFDSGDELVVETPHEKKRRLAQEPFEIGSMNLFAEELTMNPRKAKNHTNLVIAEYEINLVHYINVFNVCGNYLNELSIGTSSTKLLKIIGNNCPNLTILTIRKTESEDSKYSYSIMDSRHGHGPQSELGLCKLKRLNVGVNQSFKVEVELELILRESRKTLQEFHFTFRHLHELDQVLRILITCTWLRKFKKLGLDMIGEDGALRKHQFHQLTQLPFSLESIEIVAGIWEDVNSADINDFLRRFALSLKSIAIHGNRQGEDLMDSSLKVEIPKMECLESMTFGSVYEFEETFEDHLVEQPSTSRATPSARPSNVISLTDKHLMTIVLNFPHIMPELESIIFGHLVEIDQVHPKTFPRLKVFRVGSAWNTSVFIPTNPGAGNRFPSYPLVSEIQLPDCLKDEFFAEKIRQLFPNLLKVWLYLPSVKVLFRFIETMADSKLEKLHLKTQYDFEGTLESAILSQPWRRTWRMRKSAEVLEQLSKLKNPADDDKVYNDFIKYHNIQFPLTRGDRATVSHGLGGLTSLRVLDIEHVARVLRIPTLNNVPFYHKDARFHPYLFVGFKKYPLSPAVYNDEVRDLQKLEEFNYTKGFSVTLSQWNVKGVGQLTTKDEDFHGSFDSAVSAAASKCNADFKRLKVKLKPSMLQNDLVKIKAEKKEENDDDDDHGVGCRTASLSTPMASIKTEVKNEPL